ncbi:hypothetical protein [Hymenobacter metallicola]|uniref:Uncharacterized protein n=1 Tax=Hymenobacter metallicola TaxID=2563114 RepID=A0A4Z0QI99_9BACT|nr:hypothetical protein [Hymenobacter metallicola]TGE28973.1 hypothetical protein E5K02_05790 [Hymenobacter metallicola]
MEDMYLGRELTAVQIQEFLQSVLPGLTVFPWALLLGEQEPMAFDSGNPAHIFFEVLPSEVPQFPWHLAIYRTPSEDEEARALWFAQQLSARFGLVVLVPFIHPQKPHDPYYDIVFEQGKSYLADDRETDFGEPAAQPVRVIGPYALPEVGFDKTGNLLTHS